MREKGIDERVRSEWKRKRGKEQIKEQETSKTMKKPEESSVRGKRSYAIISRYPEANSNTCKARAFLSIE